MKNLLNIFLFAGIVALVPLGNAQDLTFIDECKIDEHWTDCGSGCGDPTCNSISLKSPVFCPDVCFVGCICNAGLVRNSAGDCVSPETCPSNCGLNEIYTTCGSGCGDLTCDLQSFAAVLCPAVCKVGCFCAVGYVRNSAGVCVLPSTCPPKCKVNEVLTDCGPIDSCEATCKNPSLTGLACPDICIVKCVCQPGYIRNSSGVCILKSTCPVCGLNEEYLDFGSPCEVSCDKPKPIFCKAALRPGCFCLKGYFRNASRKCVLLDKCPVRPVIAY